MNLNSAVKVVEYLWNQPAQREVSHSRFLKVKTMFRSYHHVTKVLVESGAKAKHARREVERLVGSLFHEKFSIHELFKNISGVSLIKQVWSTGVEYELLARDHTCCCVACLRLDFAYCDIKVLIILGISLKSFN